MLRRILIVLCLILSLAALAGCGAKQVQPQPPAASQELYVGIHTTNWEVRFRITPLLPGDRPITLKLIPHAGEIPAGTKLAVVLAPKDGAGAAQTLDAKPLGNGDYKVDSVPLTAGKWQIQLTVSPPGATPETAKYDFEVPAK